MSPYDGWTLSYWPGPPCGYWVEFVLPDNTRVMASPISHAEIMMKNKEMRHHDMHNYTRNKNTRMCNRCCFVLSIGFFAKMLDVKWCRAHVVCHIGVVRLGLAVL